MTIQHFALFVPLLALGLLSAAHAEQIRVVNLAPAKGAINIWIDNKEVRSNVLSGTASSYVGVGAGRHNVAVFSATSYFAPVLFAIDTRVGQRYSLVLEGENPRLRPFTEALEPATPAGQIRVRVYNELSSNAVLRDPTLNIQQLASGQVNTAFARPGVLGGALFSGDSSVEALNLGKLPLANVSIFVRDRDLGGGVMSSQMNVVYD